MQFKLNTIFASRPVPGFLEWKTLTKGRHQKPINTGKGIEFFKIAAGRLPVINFHSNPFKEDKDQTPWRDLIFQEEGRVIYNGDNKDSSRKAEEPRGNRKVLDILPLYFSKDRSDRLIAPPIIVTRTEKINGKTGFRKFIGLGLIHEPPWIVLQYEKGTSNVFSNYQFPVKLLDLRPEECVDWRWIDDRRDVTLDHETCLRFAPKSWCRWVEKGNETIESIQLKIRQYRIISQTEQRQMPLSHKHILNELLTRHYPKASDGIRFEAMASFIATLYFEKHDYHRGWITEGSGDRGVDFVGRLTIGHDSFSANSIIVLGQSKRYRNAISGEKLTRVASRMTRGYIGVVVSLDTFTEQAQAEVKDDKLPIILINGKKVAELLFDYMHKTRKVLSEIVGEQDTWAKSNLRSMPYDLILHYN